MDDIGLEPLELRFDQPTRAQAVQREPAEVLEVEVGLVQQRHGVREDPPTQPRTPDMEEASLEVVPPLDADVHGGVERLRPDDLTSVILAHEERSGPLHPDSLLSRRAVRHTRGVSRGRLRVKESLSVLPAPASTPARSRTAPATVRAGGSHDGGG
jgi:hypothetical protein